MSTFNSSIIDLTESFSLHKNNFTEDVIELMDTDESFNNSFGTIIERDAPKPSKDPRKTTKKPQRSRKLDDDGSSRKKELRNGIKSKTKYFGDCPICWAGLGENPLASTKCGHVYCMKCLEQSLKITKRCPTCRRVLKGSSAYHPLYINL